MAAAKTSAHDELEPGVVIKSRHELLGVPVGMPGYRKRCRCDECTLANTMRVREQRARKKPPLTEEELEALAQAAADAAMPPKLMRIDDLPAGPVTTALLEELPRIDGASLFEKTITAMMTKSAKVVDNADVLERLDLLNSMQLRILNGIQLLERGAGGGATPADAAAKLLEEFSRQDGQAS